ncbi:MAG TPA: VOC family protein [Micromonosporaceae bacterium]|jgi:catechol 2,3-dioxygenase-like lactoylglutathione lyase family enzyme
MEIGVRQANFRYIVDDVDAALEFYCGMLGFEVQMHPAPQFAMIVKDELCIALSAPSGAGGGAQGSANGDRPAPGGWNRISLAVTGLYAEVDRLRTAGARFRNDVVEGVGGRQVVLDDPSGNPVELFEAYPDDQVGGKKG